MAEESTGAIQLLRRLKAKLISILIADPDYVLQCADSHLLLSHRGYQQVKSVSIPGDKVRDLLDHVIERGPEAALGLLELLKNEDMQKMFPMLAFLKDTPLPAETTSKRAKTPESEETPPLKKKWKNCSDLLKEKQLMLVARSIGRSWKEIGRLALSVPSVKLEQIEEDNPNNHVERVFAMMRYWCATMGDNATATHLHSLLSQEDWALPSESIDFLLKNS